MLRPDSAEDAAWRTEVRAWLADNVPPALRHLTFRPQPVDVMPWYRKLSERGLIAPHWPRSHGGTAATPVQQVILMEEMALAGAPDIPSQGLNHLGPILIKCGSDDQRRQHLPKILSGEAVWCQGYSEPEAGSDLTSLRTRARRQGDALVVNGHKIWTTWGHHADWMFALVRTSDEGKARDGTTFVLIDLRSAGIRRRPIRTIAGDDEFAEVFLDDVAVPMTNVVGEVGQGWQIATALLTEERLRIGSPALALKAMHRLRMLARSLPAIGDVQMERIAQAEIEVEALIAAYLRVAESEAAGGEADGSYLKLFATETVQRVLDSAQALAGDRAALRHPLRVGDSFGSGGRNGDLLDFSEMLLQSRRLSIYGGSNEIQRNLIATRVLGLPVARPARDDSR